MSMMEERERAFEAKFAHDEELKFKVEMRRTKLIAHWAAGVMGMNAAEAQTYATSLIEADFTVAGSEDVKAKLIADFQAKNINPHEVQLEKKLAELLEVAKTQIMAG
jgi:hypothetical protein